MKEGAKNDRFYQGLDRLPACICGDGATEQSGGSRCGYPALLG